MSSKLSFLIVFVLTPLIMGVNCYGQWPDITLIGEPVVTIRQVTFPNDTLSYMFEDDSIYEQCQFDWDACRSTCVDTGPDENACMELCDMHREYCSETEFNYVQEPVTSNFCFHENVGASDIFSGCITHDPGVTATAFDGGEVTITVEFDNIDCAVPGSYRRRYCATDSNGRKRCINRWIEVEADYDPPTISMTPPPGWRTPVGDYVPNTEGMWLFAQDGCYTQTLEIDYSTIPTDAAGRFDTPGVYPVTFGVEDEWHNYTSVQYDLEIHCLNQIIFPGGEGCQDAQLLGKDADGYYLGEWARFCDAQDPDETICADDEDCTGFCRFGFHYVGPGGGPFGEPQERSIVARLKMVDPSQPSGFFYDYYDALPDQSITTGMCVTETDVGYVNNRLVYSCPENQQIVDCGLDSDTNNCEAEWQWSEVFHYSNRVDPDGPYANATCLNSGGSGR